MRISHVSPQGVSLVRSSRIANQGRSDPFLYSIMYPGSRCPLLSYLMGADVSGGVPGSVAKVGSLVDFSLGYMGSQLSSKDGGLLGESPWLS